MQRRQINRSGRRLSVDDQKAVDVLLDHGADGRASTLTRHADVVAPERMSAVSKMLNFLGELPQIEPPMDLVARTMDLIDRDITAQMGNRTATSKIPQPHVH